MSKYSSSHTKLAEFGRELLYKKSYVDGIPHISKYAKELTKTDRCSIFIYDASKHELWTTLSDGVQKIVVDSNAGLVGETLRTKKPIVENDVYSNPHFLPTVDQATGYITKNSITAPIFNSQREIQGVLQLLNKDGNFDAEDTKFITFFTHYISGFLELVTLYDKKD